MDREGWKPSEGCTGCTLYHCDDLGPWSLSKEENYTSKKILEKIEEYPVV